MIASRISVSFFWLSAAWLAFLVWTLFVQGTGTNSPLATFIVLGWPAAIGLFISFVLHR